MDARARALVAVAQARAVETEAQVRVLMDLARAKASDRDRHRRDDAVVAALAVWFGSKAAVGATRLPDDLITMLVADGIDRRAAEQVGGMATIARLTGRTQHGSPQPVDGGTLGPRVAAQEPQMRARYTAAAAERLSDAIEKGDFDHAIDVEKTYLDLHLQAATNRRRSARKLDALGKTHRYFIWRTAGDGRVEARCAGYSGRIFRVDNPPAIPGAVHLRCRCRAVPTHGPLIDWGTT